MQVPDYATAAAPVGALAPEFSLMADTGDVLRLADMHVHGPVVVVFFRGTFW